MLQNMIAITLQTTIGKLGPVPNKHGDLIKSIIGNPEKDLPRTLALGCYLDECQKTGNYTPLDKFQTELDGRST